MLDVYFFGVCPTFPGHRGIRLGANRRMGYTSPRRTMKETCAPWVRPPTSVSGPDGTNSWGNSPTSHSTNLPSRRDSSCPLDSSSQPHPLGVPKGRGDDALLSGIQSSDSKVTSHILVRLCSSRDPRPWTQKTTLLGRVGTGLS